MADPGEQIFQLDPLPAALHQLSKDAVEVDGKQQSIYNDMGCGAFSTTMAMSVHNPIIGNYQTATRIYNKMSKVPFSRGTWEGENARIAQQQGFISANLGNGTAAEIADLVRANAGAVLNIEPRSILGVVKFGAHDVALTGFSSDAAGNIFKLFVLDPWREGGHFSVGGHEDYPGNRYFVVGDQPGERLADLWTGTYTPIFRDRMQAMAWLAKYPQRQGSFKL